MADERIRLLLDMGMSAQDAEKVVVALDKVRTSARKAADGYDVLERQVGEYEVMDRRVTQTIVVQASALDNLNIQLDRNVGLYRINTLEIAGFGGAASTAMGRGGAGGQGILGASYAVQDFTAVLSGGQGLGRALSSIQNNIPIIVTALGAGAGLAGAVSIVAVGVGLLVDNWENIAGLWRKGETKEEAERMKELAKQTEAAREAAEKLAKTLPPDQQRGSKDLKRAVDAFGGEAVLKELVEALKAKSGDFGAEANREMALRLFQNLQQGNRRAQELLGDLQLRGPVGQVLRGGQTPEEENAAKLERGKQAEKDADAAFQARQKKAKAEADAKAKADDALIKDHDDAVKQEARAREKKIQDDVQLGRQLGRAARRGQGPEKLDVGAHLPMIPQNATDEQIMNITEQTSTQLMINQARTVDFVRRMNEQLQALRRIGGKLENSPMPSGRPR